MIKKIIGQNSLVEMFNGMVESNTLPRFIIITGEKGSGRKSIARYIADKMNAPIFEPEDGKINIQYIRKIIEQGYKQTSPVVYLIPDADYLNQASANALLKITEEPPNNAYFIMTVLDIRSVPRTIKSRCVNYRLDIYPKHLLVEYAKSLGMEISEQDEQIFKLCSTPGDIKNYVASELEYKALEEFTNKVIDNIGTVSGANVFKIDNSIAFKEDDEGFNLSIFWIVFNNICMKKTQEITNSKRNMYLSFIRVTGEYRQKLTILGINKRSLFDLWLLEIRDLYSRYN